MVVHYCIEGISTELVVKNLKEIKNVCKGIDDYYIFVLPTTKDSFVEVFYEKDFNEISYKELSEKIMLEIEKLNES